VSDPVVVALATVALIGLSAFFVASEFALLAARRYRLEDRAATSASARAALRSFAELPVLLAGCQLGITACTLGLGAVTKPALNYALTPAFSSWGAPGWVADVAGFVLALVIVTFLHLVVGEMAPKSWAIAHPELSATVVALPMRAFMWLTRPVLQVLNSIANLCLRRVGVEPVSQAPSGSNPDDLRHLVEHSANVGALDESYFAQLSTALDLEALTVGDLIHPGTGLTVVPGDATAADIRRATRDSGHLRILVGSPHSVTGVVHVRDTLPHGDGVPAASLMREVFRLDGSTPVYSALSAMRATRNHLALVTGPDDTVVGVVTLADVMNRLFPATTGAAAS
jgi:CBS domain containing-hemolysin-like protein